SAYAVKVANDITLTIDGTLLINTGGSLVLTSKDTTSTPIKEAGEVVLNGKIESPVGITNPIAGAYYSITEKGKITYYVEPVVNAASKIATVDAYTMTINAFDGELKVGAVSFIGATDTPATVKVGGKIAGDITLELATIHFNGKAFKGTVTNGTGTIALDGTNALTVKSTTKDDVKTLAVSGTFDAADEKTITVTGDVSFDGFNADDVTVDGNVKVVKAGTIGVMTVNGTIAVNNGITLTVTDIEILGTVAVAEADTAASKLAGTLKVTGNAFIGITEKAVVGASASLTGKAVVDEQMFVAAGSSFPADMVKDVPYVELCIEDKTWITVYDFADVGTVTIKADVVENADVTGWVDENGDSVATKVGDKYVINVVDGKVSAKIDYNIYNVTFVKAAGINDIYVDGVLFNGNPVAAGQHTVSYTLANGYTGEAKMLVDGKEVSGLTFTVGGDDLDYTITLQGIEKAPAEVGGGDAPVADKDEGMDLTDILLIVLVVLIVIMAIIVALRMMRS
ncbi:MAG: hypothetical protein IJV90_05990, partial [Candidatus Methanomethylophilaceae archaeon]|nr:hypothetical protein [Candidatus Methanomethylophilaceae archaeon]